MVFESTAGTLRGLWQARLPNSIPFGLFTSSVLHRGRKYLRTGRVSQLQFGENEIRASVNGTLPYATSLKWQGGRVACECSLPVRPGVQARGGTAAEGAEGDRRFPAAGLDVTVTRRCGAAERRDVTRAARRGAGGAPRRPVTDTPDD